LEFEGSRGAFPSSSSRARGACGAESLALPPKALDASSGGSSALLLAPEAAASAVTGTSDRPLSAARAGATRTSPAKKRASPGRSRKSGSTACVC